jgi:hypothetical protein
VHFWLQPAKIFDTNKTSPVTVTNDQSLQEIKVHHTLAVKDVNNSEEAADYKKWKSYERCKVSAIVTTKTMISGT